MSAPQKQIPTIKATSSSLILWRYRTLLLGVLVPVIMLGMTNNSAFAQPQCCRFALARYNADGSLDTRFGNDGKVVTKFPSTLYVAAYAMAIDARYRIVAVGEAYSDDEGPEFAVARYNSNGTLDTSFGGDGRVVTNFLSSTLERALAVAFDANGKILAAGEALVDGNYQFALVRYNSDGTRDTTFGGGDGKVLTNFRDGNASARAMVIDRNSKIVLAGSAGGHFALARYNTDGTRDATFGGDGAVVTDFSESSGGGAHGVAIDANGKIVAAGYARFDGNERFALARYNSDGSLDRDFGADGTGMVVTNFFSATNEYANAVAIDSNGRILLAGGANVDGNGYQFALARYNSDGRLDTTFGSGRNGKVVTNFTSSTHEVARAIAVIPSGKIILAGYAHVGGDDHQFALSRYNADGSLDTNFSGDGKVVTNFRTNEEPWMGITEAAAAVAIDASAQAYRIVAAGWAYVTD